MGVMDQVRSETFAGQGNFPPFLGSDEKATMHQTKQPFNITRMHRGPDSAGRLKWYVTIEFLDNQGEVHLMDDGEGDVTPVLRTLSFGATETRDREFPVLQRLLADRGGHLGPLWLDRAPVKNQPNPAYIFADWPPTGSTQSLQEIQPQASSEISAPPSADLVSEDGQWRWNGSQWVPNAPPPPPPSPSGKPEVITATLPFSKADQAGAQPESALPEPGTMQPLPSVADVVTGGDGEGGTTSVTRFKGDEVRQVIYRGDGVIQTPNGGLVKVTDPVEVKKLDAAKSVVVSPDGKFVLVDGEWIALPEKATESRGIAQEAENPAGPTEPPPAPLSVVQGTVAEVPVEEIPANEGKKKPVTVSLSTKCDTCNKQVKGSAFKNGKGVWILTHSCEGVDPSSGKRIGSKAINVDEQVKAILSEKED